MIMLHTHTLVACVDIYRIFFSFYFDSNFLFLFIFVLLSFCWSSKKIHIVYSGVIYLFIFFCVWTKNPRSIIIYFSVKWKVIWQKKFFVIAKFPWWKFEIYFLINDPLSIIIKNSEHMVCLVTILIIISIFFFLRQLSL